MSLTFSLVRKLVFCLVLLFSVIVIGLGADLISNINNWNSQVKSLLGSLRGAGAAKLDNSYACLAIAAAALTIVSLLIMGIVDMIRVGAPTSMISVELGWLTVLWVLWLAAGAQTAHVMDSDKVDFICSSSIPLFKDIFGKGCSETTAVEAFSFLNWIILIAYTAVLLGFCVAAAGRGNNNVWSSSVKDADFSTPPPAGEKNVTMNTTVAQTMAPTNMVSPQFTPMAANQYPPATSPTSPAMSPQYPHTVSSQTPPLNSTTHSPAPPSGSIMV